MILKNNEDYIDNFYLLLENSSFFVFGKILYQYFLQFF